MDIKKPLIIGGITLNGRAMMAPIAGMTDEPFRRIAMESGAAITVSELLSANALIRDSAKTISMTPSCDEPRPVAVQIFGGDLEVVRDAAVIVEQLDCCDLIDLNYGCPVKKVTKTGGGAALLTDPKRAAEMAAAVVSAVKKPVTVKIRAGWDMGSVNAVEIARMLEGVGVAAVVIHGRTASMGYGGRADWQLIAEVAAAVRIPVIGNGDIRTPEEALHRLTTTGCAAVMVGRGALGAPWIFGQFNKLVATGSYQQTSPEQQYATISRHIDLMIAKYGETLTARKMRTHFGYYTKSMQYASRFRTEANRIEDIDAIRELVKSFFCRNLGRNY